MKKLNRALALLVALTLALGTLYLPALAADVVDSGTCGADGDNLTWTLDGEGTLTISGEGDMEDYDPSGAPWYDYRGEIISIVIGDRVTSIGTYAFYYCTIPASVTIPDSVTSIGDGAFLSCASLTSVEIPDSVTSIGVGTFNDTLWLEEQGEFVIVNGILVVYQGTDSVVEIPDSVTSIGDEAFADCTSLTGVTIPDSVTSIGDGAFYDCDSLTSVEIPDSVTTIGTQAFAWCESLTSVTIGNSVTSIGNTAFSFCRSLTSVTIPDSVTSIERNAFTDCSSLTSINVSDNNLNYASQEGVLYSKDKTELILCPEGKEGEVVIPNSVTSIGSFAFYDCDSLTSVTIPDGVTTIDIWTFSDCTSLTSVTIPDSVTTIGNYAFSNCDSLTSVTIPSSVTTFSHSAFYDCDSLTSVTISDGVTSIGASAFSYCINLTNVTIPDSVTSIGSSAFVGCTSLTSVTIPDSVTSIGEYAFGYSNYSEKTDGFTISGHTGSAAETYAKENELTFVSITIEIQLDGTVDTYTQGSDASAVIHCSGELEDFVSVSVDGDVVDKSNYTLEDGSTILTFTSEYLDTLSVGEHTVTLTYTTGSVDTTLTVLEKAEQQPDEGTEQQPDEGTEQQPNEGTEQQPEQQPGEDTEITDVSAEQGAPSKTDAPKTGDSTNVTLWAVVLGLSAVGAGAAIVCKRKINNFPA